MEDNTANKTVTWANLDHLYNRDLTDGPNGAEHGKFLSETAYFATLTEENREFRWARIIFMLPHRGRRL